MLKHHKPLQNLQGFIDFHAPISETSEHCTRKQKRSKKQVKSSEKPPTCSAKLQQDGAQVGLASEYAPWSSFRRGVVRGRRLAVAGRAVGRPLHKLVVHTGPSASHRAARPAVGAVAARHSTVLKADVTLGVRRQHSSLGQTGRKSKQKHKDRRCVFHFFHFQTR